jgi:hypothetical protein
MAKSDTAARDMPGVPASPVRLHHDSAVACSYDGQLFEADGNGDVVVPAAAVETLAAHGFLLAPKRQPINPAGG